jgi:hypothetical protein
MPGMIAPGGMAMNPLSFMKETLLGSIPPGFFEIYLEFRGRSEKRR